MKKLLTILGAVGLTATASSAVVSCGLDTAKTASTSKIKVTKIAGNKAKVSLFVTLVFHKNDPKEIVSSANFGIGNGSYQDSKGNAQNAKPLVFSNLDVDFAKKGDKKKLGSSKKDAFKIKLKVSFEVNMQTYQENHTFYFGRVISGTKNFLTEVQFNAKIPGLGK